MSWFQQTVITLTDFNCFPCFVHKTVPVSFHHCLRFSDRMIGINQLSRDCVNNVITKQKDRKMFYRNRFVNVSVRQHTIFLCLWQMLILWWGLSRRGHLSFSPRFSNNEKDGILLSTEVNTQTETPHLINMDW